MSNDPVYGCELYKELGCAHVDGLLCDFPTCSMLSQYREDKQQQEIEHEQTMGVSDH